MTSEWHWTHNSQNFLINIKYLPPRSKFLSVSVCDKRFQDIKLLKISKKRYVLNDLRPILNSQFYHVDTKCLPQRANFCPLHSTASRFQDTRLLKVGNFRNASIDHKLTLNSWQSKYLEYTMYPWVPKLDSLCSTTSHFRDTRFTCDFLIFGNQITSKFYLENLTAKSTLHILNTYHRDPNFGSFRFMANRFPDTRWSKIGNAPNDLKLTLKTKR